MDCSNETLGGQRQGQDREKYQGKRIDRGQTLVMILGYQLIQFYIQS